MKCVILAGGLGTRINGMLATVIRFTGKILITES